MIHLLEQVAGFFREYKEYATIATLFLVYLFQYREMRKERKECLIVINTIRKEKETEIAKLNEDKEAATQILHEEVLSLALESERNRSANAEALRSLKELLIVMDRRD